MGIRSDLELLKELQQENERLRKALEDIAYSPLSGRYAEQRARKELEGME